MSTSSYYLIIFDYLSIHFLSVRLLDQCLYILLWKYSSYIS
jgi:hypothetical protein